MKAMMFQKLAPATVTRRARVERRRLPESIGRVTVAARTAGLE
jgi:hypothetical protein